MLKFGIISEIDFANGLARVLFDEDDLVSAPLKISVMRSGPDQFSFPFDVNEHVWCLMDEHCEYGVIGGAIYDENNIPAGSAKGKLRIKFADNSIIEYDRISHILNLNIQGKVTVNCTESDLVCSSKATVAAPEVDIHATAINMVGVLNLTGAANITGVVSLGGLASITPGVPVDGSTADLNVKSVTATGAVTADTVTGNTDVMAGTKNLKAHKHTSSSGGGLTSSPV